MKPVVFVATLIRMIDLFRTFGVVYGLTQGGPGTATQLVSINIYEQMFINNQVGVAAAIAVVYLVFVIAIANIVIAKVGFEGCGTDGDDGRRLRDRITAPRQRHAGDARHGASTHGSPDVVVHRAVPAVLARLDVAEAPGTANSLPPDWIFLPTLYNYIQLIQDSGFVAAFANSLLMVSASVVLVLLIGVPAAYVLSRYDIPMEQDVLVWILSSRMLPPIAVVLPFFIIFQEFNLFDTRIGMVLMYVSINLSLVVWVMKAFFDRIPETLEEAARVDGATQFRAS